MIVKPITDPVGTAPLHCNGRKELGNIQFESASCNSH